MANTPHHRLPHPVGIDHLVLTVANPAATALFYGRAVGAVPSVFGPGRVGLLVGAQRINLHTLGCEHPPHAEHPTPGAADVCILVDGSMADLREHLAVQGIPVEEGPVERQGAGGPLVSVYVRDPDGNLVEISVRG